MKFFMVILTSLLLTVIAQGDSPNDPEQILKTVIDSGTIDGHASKVIGPMGDAAAVVISKILADRELQAKDIDGALWILGQAFADPSVVKNSSDRQPRSALLLLKYFYISTTDTELRKRIEETRKYVENRIAKTTRPNDEHK
jgi:hypothetical protein